MPVSSGVKRTLFTCLLSLFVMCYSSALLLPLQIAKSSPSSSNALAFSRTTTRMASTTVKHIAVIGGGASGIFASISAAESIQKNHQAAKVRVTVLEATTKTLAKVLISGGGRCNVLHDTSKPVSELLQGYPRGRKELNGILHKRFSPATAQEWFESRGVQLKTEADGRMFPTTDSSQTIIDTLLRAAADARVHIQFRSKVESVEALGGSNREAKENNRAASKGSNFCITLQSKKDAADDQSSDTKLYFDSVILATGSMPAGYRLIQGLNHSLVSTVPSLFTLNAKTEVKTEEGFLYGLAGISVPYAQVSFRVPGEKKPLQTNEGPLLVTHHGLSGPAVLRLSAFGARDLAQYNYRGTLRIQWAPHLGSTNEIFDDLWEMTTARPKKQVAKYCPFLLPSEGDDVAPASAIPKRLWAAMAKRVGFEEGQVWATASKKLVRKLAMQINECDVEITGKGTFKEEFVTAGGVSLKEIDMRTMQSKLYPGLFFCGELCDVDGVTGGYNFLNCWSTGFVAGNSAADFVLAPDCHSVVEEGEQVSSG